MPSIFDRIDNREAYPVPGCDLCLREPLIGEITRAMAVPTDHQKSMLLALCAVAADGSAVMTQQAEETDEQFAKRAFDEVQGMRSHVFAAMQKALADLLKPVDPTELAKN